MGSVHAKHKVNEATVGTVKEALRQGLSVAAVAKALGLSEAAVRDIRNWANDALPAPPEDEK